MSEQLHDEKEEKEEKEEKQEEEKSWEEKYRRDPLDAIGWAVLLVWAGVVFLLENLGLLDGFVLSAWNLIFTGGGVITLVVVVIRLLVAEYYRPVGGSVIFGVILLAIGLGDWIPVWPLALIGVGAAMLLRAFRSRE